MRDFIKNLIKKISYKLIYIKGNIRHLKVIDSRLLYQYWEQEHLKKVFNKYQIDCVFDVGANYGQYAQMIRRNVGYKGLIISFEPLPKAAEHLRLLAKNDSNWIIQEEALSFENGEQIFNIMVGNQFSSLSTPNHQETALFKNWNEIVEEVVVKTETLESAYARLKSTNDFKSPFLKLDTQGYDTTILANSTAVLKSFVGIQSELAVQKLYEHSIDFREAISIYETYGFSLSAFVPNNAGHFPRLIETDCVMIRNDLI